MNRNIYSSARKSGYGTAGYGSGARSARPAFTQNSCPITSGDGVDGMPLAMAYVPNQSFVNLYSPSDALANGTLFGDLNLPYCAGGKR